MLKVTESPNRFCLQTMKSSNSFINILTKFMVYFIAFSLLAFVAYYLKLIYPPGNYLNILTPIPYREKQALLLETRSAVTRLVTADRTKSESKNIKSIQDPVEKKTELRHIVFGIAASAKLWSSRKNYVKLWWQKERMRGYVWLDRSAAATKKIESSSSLPPVKISSNTSQFKYKNKSGSRSAIRLTRIVSEILRLGELENVRWIVLGDDDTFFVPDNLVRVLRKYDHNQFYYIGSISETHLQNVRFSFNMAFGGGGFAISYPLAVALEKMQDRCIKRYPELYGSDDRIQACMAELGVPLTKEIGFHQFDLFNNVFGLLAAHPVAPLVSLHHLDVIQPIFPDMNQLQALKKLSKPMKLDSAALMQQSICYDRARNWTISVSWGYVVQIIRGIIPPRQMEIPARTFLNWYKDDDETGFIFNTRPLSKNICQAPSVYILRDASYNVLTGQTTSQYTYHPNPTPKCDWKMADPSRIRRVDVHKKPNPFLWEKAPRRNCCRVLSSKKKESTMEVDVGECKDGEVIEL